MDKHYFFISPRGFSNEGKLVRTSTKKEIEKLRADENTEELSEDEAINLAVRWTMRAKCEEMYGSLDEIVDLEGDYTGDILDEIVRAKSRKIAIEKIGMANSLLEVRDALEEWGSYKANDIFEADEFGSIIEDACNLSFVGWVDELRSLNVDPCAFVAYDRFRGEAMEYDGGFSVFFVGFLENTKS